MLEVLAGLLTFQNLCSDHAFFSNLNVVVVVKDSILCCEWLHWLLLLQLNGFLGRSNHFPQSVVGRCQGMNTRNGCVLCQYFFCIHFFFGCWSEKLKQLVRIMVGYTKDINLKPLLGVL